MSKLFCKSLKGKLDYLRIDFRADSKGNVYFLECIYPPYAFYPPEDYYCEDIILTLDREYDHIIFY